MPGASGGGRWYIGGSLSALRNKRTSRQVHHPGLKRDYKVRRLFLCSRAATFPSNSEINRRCAATVSKTKSLHGSTKVQICAKMCDNWSHYFGSSCGWMLWSYGLRLTNISRSECIRVPEASAHFTPLSADLEIVGCFTASVSHSRKEKIKK